MHQTFDSMASESFVEEENLEGTQHILVVSSYKFYFSILIYKTWSIHFKRCLSFCGYVICFNIRIFVLLNNCLWKGKACQFVLQEQFFIWRELGHQDQELEQQGKPSGFR